MTTTEQTTPLPSGATQPAALAITVCMGSSCFCRGNNKNIQVIQDYLKSRKLPESVVLAGQLCGGECKKGPNIKINGELYSDVDPISVIGLLNRHCRER